MRYQKILGCAFAVLVSGSAFANGFYAGLGAGFNNFNDQVKTTDTTTVLNDATFSYGETSLLGTAFGGYQFNFPSKFNLGLEAFYNFTNATDKLSDFGGSSSLTVRDSYGVRALPGYQLAPNAEIHAIVGYVRGAFRLSDDGFVEDSPPPAKNFDANGWQVGLGTGLDLMKNIALRADLVYTDYQSYTYTAAIPGGSVSYKNSIASTVGTVSLAYKFG